MAIKKPQPLPNPAEPLVDPKTGKINPRWYQYFKDADRLLREAIDLLNVEFP